MDRFTIGHFLIGGFMARKGFTAAGALATAIAWELVENRLKDMFPKIFPLASYDSKINSFMDVIGWMVGYAWFSPHPMQQ